MKKLVIFLLSIIFLSSLSQPVLANDCVETALGCVPAKDPQQFVAWLLARAIGIGGGIAFLLMIIAGFQIITSTGNPEKLQAGKQLLSSAVTGLLFIIFSLFLLQLIGVKILEIPGLGG